jgi:ATP-dependent helicase/nuclease subunit A
VQPTAPDSGADAVGSATEDTLRVLEGVIDLAFREADGWVVADYKTDVGTDPDFPNRQVAYRRQVELYAEAWARLSGEPVKERVLFFTTQGRVESW